MNAGQLKWFFRALAYSLSNLSVLKLRPVREEFFEQLESAGVQSLGLVGTIGILAGTLIIDQSVRMAGAAGEVPVKLLGWTLFGEAGALAVGFLVAARVAPTMGANLALMRFRGELERLAAINISIADYLIVPRVAALMLVSAVLAIYFMACALFGGMLLASLLRNFSFLDQVGRFFGSVNAWSMLGAVMKCSLFGGIVALVSCYQGLVVERDAKRLAEAGSEALTRSILMLGIMDAGIMLVSAFIGK